jgi:hypothetical protein
VVVVLSVPALLVQRLRPLLVLVRVQALVLPTMMVLKAVLMMASYRFEIPSVL